MAYGFNDDKSKKDLKAAILELAYPVGSIYQSTNNTSPQTFLGGTWQAITGRFLVAQGSNGQSGNAALNLSAGATGGEKNHTLGASEIPYHTHTMTDSGYVLIENRSPIPVNSAASGNQVGIEQSGTTAYITETKSQSSGGGSHNNLPPYLAVYMWKRTA